MARWLAALDRGQNVRKADELVILAQEHFSTVNVTVRHDLLRIPYTHAILECQKAIAT